MKGLIRAINEVILFYKKDGGNVNRVSDGYHTFGELYHHRMILTLCLALSNKEHSWKSKLHHDGTMFNDYFVAGFTTPNGQYSYHYKLEHWDLFKDIKELEFAPEYDGHKPSDIGRLLSLYKANIHETED